MCPELDQKTGNLVDVYTMQVDPHLYHLYAYLLENGFVKALDTVNRKYLSIYSHEVLDKIQNGDMSWEDMVPAEVVRMIRAKRLFAQ